MSEINCEQESPVIEEHTHPLYSEGRYRVQEGRPYKIDFPDLGTQRDVLGYNSYQGYTLQNGDIIYPHRSVNSIRLDTIWDFVYNKDTFSIPLSCLVEASPDDVKSWKQKKQAILEEQLKKVKDAVLLMESSLEAVFPGNWDLSIKELDYYDDDDDDVEYQDNGIELIVRFPEITLKNSNEDTFQIKELYIQLLFSLDLQLLSTLRGRRGMVSYLEFKNTYSHSHLSISNINYEGGWLDFCLGSTDLNIMISEWRDGNINSFDINQFELLLYQIDSYVRWESLEGGPYRRFQTLTYPSANINSIGEYQKSAAYFKYLQIAETIPLYYNGIEKTFYVDNACLVEELNKRTEPEFIKVITNINREIVNGTFDVDEAKKDIQTFQKYQGRHSESNSFEFQGNSIRTYIDEESIIVPPEIKYYKITHPAIADYIALKLGQFANHYLLKHYGK